MVNDLTNCCNLIILQYPNPSSTLFINAPSLYQYLPYYGKYETIFSDADYFCQSVLWIVSQRVSNEPVSAFFLEMSHDMTKPTKWVRPEKTQISLDIRPVWSVFDVRSMGS